MIVLVVLSIGLAAVFAFAWHVEHARADQLSIRVGELETITQDAFRVRAKNEPGLLLPGFFCAKCGGFTGRAKDPKRKDCRSCGTLTES